MPEAEFKHVTIRSKTLFSRFRVIPKMSHLDEDDQKQVRKHVPKNKRGPCKYTVGKLKGGRKIEGRSWKLQKIMVPKKSGGDNVGKRKKKKGTKGKKWGKIGAPNSQKRKNWMKKIRKKK